MSTNAGLCKRVKLFIDEHFAAIQSIAQIAEKFEISPAWLTRAFRTQYDLGPKEYLDAIRIREAMKLLEKRKLHCYEVAHAVGLKDEDALGKLFKRQDIPSPTVLRKTKEEFSRRNLSSKIIDRNVRQKHTTKSVESNLTFKKNLPFFSKHKGNTVWRVAAEKVKVTLER